MSLPSAENFRAAFAIRQDEAHARIAADPRLRAKLDQATAGIREIAKGLDACIDSRDAAVGFLCGIELAITQLETHLVDPGGCLDRHLIYMYDLEVSLIDEVTRC